MRDPENNHIKVEPTTLVLIVSVLILLPLLVVGFFSQ